MTCATPSTDACADPGGPNGISPDCWKSLNVNKHLVDWAGSHRMGWCKPNTPFAQCFLQVLDVGMNDCIGITSGTCPPPSWTDFKRRNISVEDYYIAYSIYSIWSFFNSYYTAIGNARSIATDSIAAIVALLDPPQTTNTHLNDILTALSAGFAFLNPMAGGAIFAVVAALQQAPNVAKYVWPKTYPPTQFAQFASISNAMSSVTQYLQSNVSTALATIQGDAPTFLSVTKDGQFSTNPLPTIPAQSSALLTGLNTFVISQCLAANNWHVARAIDTDINGLAANGSKINWKIPGCGLGYDDKRICGAYYWNKPAMISYTLVNSDDLFRDPTPLMQQLFANWTTPALLFDGAAACQARTSGSGAGSGSDSPTITPNGVAGITTSCLSNLKVCTWDVAPGDFGTQYQYTDCAVDRGFARTGCRNCVPRDSMCVNLPPTYVGGFLLDPRGASRRLAYCVSGDGHFVQRHSSP